MVDREDHYRQKGYRTIIGIDEAGRGPLAGPVVAAAVCLKSRQFIETIKDSKLISPSKRLKAFNEILEKATVGVGIINETAIDQLNILNATYAAMHNAVWHLLSKLPESRDSAKPFDKQVCLLIDGNRFVSEFPYKVETIPQGDVHVFSISCASIIAKVVRDRILETYDKIYPQYGFKKHKGYPTVDHKNAIRRFGPSLIHRKTFHCR